MICICMSFTLNGSADINSFPETPPAIEPKLNNEPPSNFDEYLAVFEEKPLDEYSEDLIFRFIWLRTFDAPMTFRLTKDKSGSYLLFFKGTDGKGGYGIGKLNLNEKIYIMRDEADSLLKLIEGKCNFWIQPSHESDMGIDGAQWIFEFKKSKHYHLIQRWSPNQGCTSEIGITLIEMSKLKVGDIY
jgi:hypothetical protein